MRRPKSSAHSLIFIFIFHLCGADECGFDCLGMLEDSKMMSPGPQQHSNSGLDDKIPPFLAPREGVKFFLYNREIRERPEVIALSRRGENGKMFSTFNRNKTTKIIIHGWKAYVPSLITNVLRNAYLSVGDYNLIMVDWSSSGSLDLYPWAKSSIPMVATELAAFIDDLYYRYGIRAENLHVIGHSLGAHVAGVAGRLITVGRIGRISGLDPAGPLFSISQPMDRLSRGSALFVDVVHTCANYLGYGYPLGHVDFYPNRGTPVQPGCGLDLLGTCSHRRAYGYFSESILNPEGFISTSCYSWASYLRGQCANGKRVPMGEFVPTSARGVYYLRTNSRQPFGRVLKKG